MLPEDVAYVIIPLHVITGSEYTSGLYGHENKTLMQKLMEDPGAGEHLGWVGEYEVNADMKVYPFAYGQEELQSGWR